MAGGAGRPGGAPGVSAIQSMNGQMASDVAAANAGGSPYNGAALGNGAASNLSMSNPAFATALGMGQGAPGAGNPAGNGQSVLNGGTGMQQANALSALQQMSMPGLNRSSLYGMPPGSQQMMQASTGANPQSILQNMALNNRQPGQMFSGFRGPNRFGR